jgi:hypothetical protein
MERLRVIPQATRLLTFRPHKRLSASASFTRRNLHQSEARHAQSSTGDATWWSIVSRWFSLTSCGLRQTFAATVSFL